MTPLLERELDREIQRNARTIRAKQAQERREAPMSDLYDFLLVLTTGVIVGATVGHAVAQWFFGYLGWLARLLGVN